ncbi:MAG: hypothetical protein IPJ65_01290 [Archangiaceae bacterium]|nr:hypothetical protein [Archangiaceae bacterium]
MVFAIRNKAAGQTIWVRAGVAFVQPDDSMNLILDVLPIDGQLHIREATPKHHPTHNHSNHPARAQQAPQPPPVPQPSMGGH